MKKCTKGGRHKWKFEKNYMKISCTTKSTRVSKQGLYRCECGEWKAGRSQFERIKKDGEK